MEAFGKQVYVSNEYDKRTVKLDVDDNGYVTNMQRFAEKGEFFQYLPPMAMFTLPTGIYLSLIMKGN